MTSARDRRQLELMIALLARYQRGEIALGVLIRDLEALLAALESVPEAWKASFHERWFDLEQVFAVALNRDYEAVLKQNERLLSSAVTELTHLVAKAASRDGEENEQEE